MCERTVYYASDSRTIWLGKEEAPYSSGDEGKRRLFLNSLDVEVTLSKDGKRLISKARREINMYERIPAK